MTVNLGELVATTLRSRTGDLADNISNKNALLFRLSQGDKIETHDGGRTIVKELEYAENDTFMYYSGYQALNISPSATFDAAEYDWKHAACAVTISGPEKRKNAGALGLIKLAAKRTDNAMKTMKNQLSTGSYSDGTGSGGLQIGGLQSIVADDPTTGSVGGIDAATYTWWRNKVLDASDAGAAVSSSNVLTYMNTLYNQLTRGDEAPDLVVADLNYFGFFEGSQQANQRFADSKMAEAGFQAYKYKGADVVLDNGSGIPTNHMYFLNTDYLTWDVHADANMTPLDARMPTNQDAEVVPVVWMGNLTCSNRSMQGVLKA